MKYNVLAALCKLASSLKVGPEKAAANTASTNRLIIKDTNNAIAENIRRTINNRCTQLIVILILCKLLQI